MLRRAAAALELGLDELDGAAERRLLETLTEIAHAPDLAALGAEAASAGELVGRYPGWARALAALARSERAATAEARALADRLTHDPFLGEAVHRMLTRIAAIRSAAEILTDYADIPPDQRDRFHVMVRDEACALSEVAEALAAYFDKAEETRRALTPLDEVEALFEARGNRFDEIEAAAPDLARRLAGPAPLAATPPAADLGATVESMTPDPARQLASPPQSNAPAPATNLDPLVQTPEYDLTPKPAGTAPAPRLSPAPAADLDPLLQTPEYDLTHQPAGTAPAPRLSPAPPPDLAHRLPGPVPRLLAARALAAAELGPIVEMILDAQPEIETAAARGRARAALLDHAAEAILAPMPAFALRAAALGYDLEALSADFGLEAHTVCRRLVALTGEGVPRFGYFRVNAAGTVIERSGLAGLVAPRYAPACPLWVLYRAQQSPEAVIRQRAVFPTGDRFVFVARAHNSGVTGFGRPRHYLTDMLAMTEADARLTVYAPDASVPAEEVGPACRVCPRPACPHRVADPLAG